MFLCAKPSKDRLSHSELNTHTHRHTHTESLQWSIKSYLIYSWTFSYSNYIHYFSHCSLYNSHINLLGIFFLNMLLCSWNRLCISYSMSRLLFSLICAWLVPWNFYFDVIFLGKTFPFLFKCATSLSRSQHTFSCFSVLFFPVVLSTI
jgi:hypothetical protein